VWTSFCARGVGLKSWPGGIFSDRGKGGLFRTRWRINSLEGGGGMEEEERGCEVLEKKSKNHAINSLGTWSPRGETNHRRPNFSGKKETWSGMNGGDTFKRGEGQCLTAHDNED